MIKELQSNNFNALLIGFTEWLHTMQKSESTQKNYPMGVKEYFLYLENHFGLMHINKVDKKHSESFKLHLQQRINKTTKTGGISNQHINGITKSLNSFAKFIADNSEAYKYAITCDYLPVETAEKIVLTQDEVKELYNATFESYPHNLSSVEYGQRDRVILALLYGAGLRMSEAVNIDLSDIDFVNKKILVRKGKRSKQRFVPMPQQLIEDIKTYIQQGRHYFTESHQTKCCRKKTIKKKAYNEGETALLLNIWGTRLGVFSQRLNYLKEKTSITKNTTPHVLRHSYATHMYQNGMDLDNIRLLLGHTSIDTTQIYVHIAKQLEQNNITE